MNISSIDVTNIPDLSIGTKVEVISNNTDDKNSIENLSKMINTIPYELLVHILGLLKRKVI